MSDAPPYINIGNNVQVFDIESGTDITNCVQNIDIKVYKNEWVTAVLECDIGELELHGIEIEEIKNKKIVNLKKIKDEYYRFKDEDDYHRHTCNSGLERKNKEN